MLCWKRCWTPDAGGALSGRIRRTAVMEGVRVCSFDCALPDPPAVPPLAALHFELLFCLSGSLRLERRDGRTLCLREGEILLVSDASAIHRLTFRMAGWAASWFSWMRRLRAKVWPGCACCWAGCGWIPHRCARSCRRTAASAVLRDAAWADAVFAALRTFPPEDRARYSVLKAAELLYLLCSDSSLLRAPSAVPYHDRYQLETAQQVQEYMVAHLAEPMTIAQLAARFHISPTALKDCFRQLYAARCTNTCLNAASSALPSCCARDACRSPRSRRRSATRAPAIRRGVQAPVPPDALPVPPPVARGKNPKPRPYVQNRVKFLSFYDIFSGMNDRPNDPGRCLTLKQHRFWAWGAVICMIMVMITGYQRK